MSEIADCPPAAPRWLRRGVALGVVLVRLFIENIRETTVRPFDLPGFALTGIGLASLALRMAPDAGAEVSGRAVAGKLPGE